METLGGGGNYKSTKSKDSVLKYTNCVSNDAKQIYNMVHTEWPHDYRTIQNFEKKIQMKSLNGIVCKKSYKIIGVILYQETTINREGGWKKQYFNTKEFKFDDGKQNGNKKPFIHITDLVVDKKFRKKGIASTLVFSLLLKQDAQTRIGLECAYDNNDAIKLYRKAGFVQGGFSKSTIYFTLILK